MALGKHILLEGDSNVFSTSGRVLPRSALSFFRTKSPALRYRPDRHYGWIYSDALLSHPILIFFAFYCVSGCSCSVLSRLASRPGFSRCAYLRPIVRFLLLRSADLLYSYPRERRPAASPPFAWISSIICLR